MPHLVSNLYEKSYTPFTAKLAPRNMWNRPVLRKYIDIMTLLILNLIERKPQKVSRFGADPRVKAFWRFIRSWVCHNHKLYYSYVMICSMGLYNFWWHTLVGYYRAKNAHVSYNYFVDLLIISSMSYRDPLKPLSSPNKSGPSTSQRKMMTMIMMKKKSENEKVRLLLA